MSEAIILTIAVLAGLGAGAIIGYAKVWQEAYELGVKHGRRMELVDARIRAWSAEANLSEEESHQ